MPKKKQIKKEEKKKETKKDKKKETKEEKKEKVKPTLEDTSVLKYVHMTEKPISMIEVENKLVFIVDRGVDKAHVKQAVERLFEAKVKKVNIQIDQKGRKKAYVKFAEPEAAGEIAMRLGII